MWLDNVVIPILLLPILYVVTKGTELTPGGSDYNFTAERLSSPWLEKVMNHPKPRPSGCWKTPWICRKGESPPARLRCCRNQCVDVSSDPNNCGFCGIRCPFAWQCCHGFCVDTNINHFNCGRCGNRCPRGVRCLYGMCGYGGQPTSPDWPRPPFPFPPKPPKPWPPHHHPHPPKGGDEQPSSSLNGSF
ncbi:hypothetical protein K2173_023773 [Erythroxylum novogranatense]|uniref:Stigma-specific Stig1 family protein n=1 Tax=Erythroxylum novogranatense TaxID=1862640 RepID=A0AAV8THZ6_9ROSI|nr:hypothetical protein K2173_023773 [Erythroxylum novogranatense]